MEPIRVLHMIGSLNAGGSQAMLINFYKAIDRRKIQFDFVIDHSDELFWADEVKSMGGRIFTMPAFQGYNLFQVRHAWSEFFQSHPEYKILHSHLRSYASLYLPIAKKYGLKTIIHSHSTSNGSGISSVIKAVLQYPLRYQADYLFACSQEAGKWLFGERALMKSNYYFVPNGIDIAKFKYDTADRLSVRSEYGIKNEMFVVGHVGSFRVAKNHEFLLSVFKCFHEKHADSVLLLLGAGDRFDHIKQLCSELNLDSCVIFAGSQQNVAKFYSAMDCFFFPSFWEGLPVSLVEAQASGLPCLISDTITKDIYLTDLIQPMSLKQSQQAWTEYLLTYARQVRKELDPKMQSNLMGFDSVFVANWLQNFYLNIDE